MHTTRSSLEIRPSSASSLAPATEAADAGSQPSPCMPTWALAFMISPSGIARTTPSQISRARRHLSMLTGLDISMALAMVCGLVFVSSCHW